MDSIVYNDRQMKGFLKLFFIHPFGENELVELENSLIEIENK